MVVEGEAGYELLTRSSTGEFDWREREEWPEEAKKELQSLVADG